MQRLIVVYNPNSSQYVHVKANFLTELPKLNGYTIGKYAIKKAPFSDNVVNLQKILKKGDIVIAAGGDATASIAMNAILLSKKDITFGVLPYGNFNDLARTLGTMNTTRMLGYLKGQESSPLAVKRLYPLDVIVDGKHWRYASGYVTIGMTAEAVELFDEPKFRKKMQKGHKSSWRSYIALVKWYFKNRHKREFIPEFKLNGKLQHRKTSDYAAVSGRSMCRVMKGGDDYLDPKKFRSMTDRLTNFWRLFKLMVAAILVRTPGTETTGDILEFTKPATVELQAEGEYQVFKNIKTIEIKKGTKCLKVIHN